MLQFPLGWFMPHIHRGMQPGDAMTFHISFGITILALIVLRFFRRIIYPVAPASSLPVWQQLISQLMQARVIARSAGVLLGSLSSRRSPRLWLASGRAQ